MRVQCPHCGKKYTLPDARVAGRILKIRCRQCKELFEIDGSDISVEELERTATTMMASAISLEEAMKTRVNQVAAPQVAPPAPPAPPASLLQAQVAPVTPEHTTQDGQEPEKEVRSVDPAPSQGQPHPLAVEVSESAQEWMTSVMSDVDRPMTQDIRIDEITGIRSLPPQRTSNAAVLMTAVFGLLALGGALYWFATTQSSVRRDLLSVEVPVMTGDVDTQSGRVATLTSGDQPSSSESKPSTEELDTKQEVKDEVVPTSSKARTQSTKSKSKVKDDMADLSGALKSLASSAGSTPSQLEGQLVAATGTTSQASELKASRVKKKPSKRQSKSKAKTKPKPKGKTKKVDRKTKSRSKSKASAKAKAKAKAPSKKRKKASAQSKAKSKRSVRRKSKGKGLDRSTIARIMQENASGLQYCYQKILKRDPQFGEVNTSLRFRVGTNGRVSRSTISLSGVFKRTRLESCIQNTVQRWYFPSASGDTPVRYPLRFSPGY